MIQSTRRYDHTHAPGNTRIGELFLSTSTMPSFVVFASRLVCADIFLLGSASWGSHLWLPHRVIQVKDSKLKLTWLIDSLFHSHSGKSTKSQRSRALLAVSRRFQNKINGHCCIVHRRPAPLHCFLFSSFFALCQKKRLKKGGKTCARADAYL
jgi:hypothetical protein